MEQHEGLTNENTGASNETTESQEEESVVYFRQRLADTEKKIELLVTSVNGELLWRLGMQDDLEILFTQLASQIVETIQNQMTPITEHIEEQCTLCGRDM